MKSENDTGRALCGECKAITETTYVIRDVNLSDGSGVLSGLLVGVCNTCDTICSMPDQSVEKVRALVSGQKL